ncbi:MAG: aminotransferase class V-fold PLP-dependent enzyme [candidate division WOR-3 bacterium]|nr:MAG: aminotransferase class V-fold PLP-dependent enzyme [candidate division WOR-3 bacterium]
MQRYCDHGIVCNREMLELVEEARNLAARLVHAEPAEITFVKNTTQGLLLAANGIRWQKGDNVVIPEKEFPANVFPWLNLTEAGVEVRFVPLRGGRFTVEDIDRFVDSRTRAISVSAVSFVDGFRCDLEGIGRYCKDKDIFFVVDAIQALGAVDVDVRECRCDVLSADSHKWLLGPQGIGFAYVSTNALDRLKVSNMGWMSMTDEGNHLCYDIRLKHSAARFEEGTLNILGIMGLKATLEMLLAIGIPVIQSRILELLDQLVAGLTEKNYEIRSSMKISERSGILSFAHRQRSAEEIFRRLFEANVVCALRDNAVRLSPHFYNNTVDIRKFLDALC